MVAGCAGIGEEEFGDAVEAAISAINEADEATESEEAEDTAETEASEEIAIVYTNDIHSYIDNVVEDGDGNVIGDGLRYSKIAALVQDLEAEGKNVYLVDAGDHIQGDIYGALDEGETIVSLMHATGYDLTTPGNHEFDYGMMRFMKLIDETNFDYLSCNFKLVETGENVLPSSKIVTLGGKKIAFIGITTSDTITSAAPIYFQDEKGEYIYTIDGIAGAQELFDSVQAAIDEVRDEAELVIALGHIGVDKDAVAAGKSSIDIIENTTGLDAFIDGHSHTVIESEIVTDKEGNDVVLTQTGSYLKNVGLMTISSDGSVTTELISELDREDEEVAALENEWIENVETQLGEKVAVQENTLYINNPENENERWIRAKELNLGDFAADSMYWYFNEKLELDCDVAMANAGGIRTQLDAGDFTYMSAKAVEPFGNMICLIKATGQEIIDALEMGVTLIGEWDYEWNTPAENGGFMQVAGINYTIDATVESSIVTSDAGEFERVDGEYRVKDVEVYNRETGKYDPIDPDKEYTLAAANYLLRNGGEGLVMFMDDEGVIDYVGEDYIILAEYAKSFDGDEYPVLTTENSPLSSYEGYLIDYENPEGAGRITQILE